MFLKWALRSFPIFLFLMCGNSFIFQIVRKIFYPGCVIKERHGLRTLSNMEEHIFTSEDTSVVDNTNSKFVVVISNLQSGSNIGSICRNALAFNAHEVVIVGRKGIPRMRGTDRGARGILSFSQHSTIQEAAAYVKSVYNCTIYGVEITESSIPVTALPFCKSSAFIFGNEGGGLSQRQREACDYMIHIPQYAPRGMASINVACASAIIMQWFAVWAEFSPAQIKGEKFI